MAAISLSAYQDKLSGLLAEGRHEEVIAHARHILKTHPKNLRAYQQLSEALFACSRWDEAAEVLRRLLGAQPQDFYTQSRLARSYQQLGQFDRAIWHAERALDQQPEDQDTISLIRSLYREARGLEIERLQLSSVALAQQHIRSNLLDDALTVLGDALERNPGRIDMQLMRARTLWLDGQRTGAAETAAEILDQLPYSLAANRIMSELWLAEERPSDAQLYLRRIEELDPYLAHQLAAGEAPPEALVTLEELDYAALPEAEQTILSPEWLDNTRDAEADEAAEIAELFQSDSDEQGGSPARATADLEDLLSADEIDALFQELISDDAERAEAVAGDDGSAIIVAMDERGLFSDENEVRETEDGLSPTQAQNISAQVSGDEGAEGLDDELSSLLAQLDDDDDDSSWIEEIQQESLNLLDEESLDYLEDMGREYVKQPAGDAGAPWLSAAIRELDDNAADFDLFADDEGLQKLLKSTSETEPLELQDIEEWLYSDDAEPDQLSAEEIDKLVELDDGLLDESSWLDQSEADAAAELPLFGAPAVDDEDSRRNLELIDSWQQELGVDDDEEDDPYIDWLSEGAADDLDDLLAANAAEDPVEASAAELELDPVAPEDGDPSETARAWGLKDEQQLADFVEDEVGLAEAEVAPSWLNAMVPGIDRESDTEPENELEFARPLARPGADFAWVSDIVEEETGEMAAVQEPLPAAETPYFRFSKPPLWLAIMRGEHRAEPDIVIGAVAAAALPIADNLDELELDDLTFDDYFNIDTPTDKMDAINLDDEGADIDFTALEWDDYFDFESPTEKTIAITLDDDPANINFEELGLEDEDFDYDTPTDKMPAITLDAEPDPLEFDDIGLDDPLSSAETNGNESGDWLEYGDLSGKDDFAPGDRDKSRGPTPT